MKYVIEILLMHLIPKLSLEQTDNLAFFALNKLCFRNLDIVLKQRELIFPEVALATGDLKGNAGDVMGICYCMTKRRWWVSLSTGSWQIPPPHAASCSWGISTSQTSAKRAVWCPVCVLGVF